MTALIYAPFPDRESARSAIAALLEGGLIGCANILGEVESHFIWNDRPDHATEVGVLFKTSANLLEEATARMAALHPYEVPAIMGWHCDNAPDSTRKWLSALDGGKAQ